MYLVLEKRLITRLKTVLHSNYLFIVLFLILGLFLSVKIFFREDKSIYSFNDNEFEFIVNEYEFDGNKLSLTLTSDEDLIGIYYIDTYEELLMLKEVIKYGVKLKLFGSLEVPSNNTIPNIFDYEKYLSNKDIFYILKIDNMEVIDSNVNFLYYIKNIVSEHIDSIDSTGYMKAFILGNNDGIQKEVYTVYQKIGVVHLFAFSGTYIILICTMILKIFKKTSFYKKFIVIVIVLILSGFIVGFSPSIKRCILFFIFNGINKILKIDISNIKVLLLVAIVLIFNDYKIIYDIGFLYSFITVFGIMLGSIFINHDNKLVSSFRLSLVAFIFSLPISLSNFYEVNLLSVFYNMIFIPFVSIIIFPLSLISCAVPCLINVFSFFINIMESVSVCLSNFTLFNIYLDFNMVETILYYVITLFMFYKSEYRLGFLLVLIVIIDLLIPYLDSASYVYFLDVGQGDSSLVISPYRKDSILIDVGGVVNYVKEEWMKKDKYYVSDNVIMFMKSAGINSIGSLILTHGDYDHMGDAINLINNFKVEKVIFNCGEFNELEQDLIEILDKNKIPYYSCIKELNISDNKLYFLNYKDYGNENDNSSVIYTELDNHKLLFMGDAGVVVEEDLIEKYNLQDIDVLKVGHHGSKTSSSKLFIDEVNPKYSIISVGKNNRYGHPNKEVLDNLDESRIYRTDIDGSIMFKIKNNKLNE